MYEKELEKHFISSKGMTAAEYFNPPSENTKSMLDMAKKIKELVNNGKTIRIVGDYDVDGVCSTAIMVRSIRAIGGKVAYRIPERLTEGYGLSQTIVNETNEDVIITVDNGISAFNEIKKAKEKGKIVLIIDHHEPEVVDGVIKVPDADIIVNHKVSKDTKTDYCGAGLCYRIISNLINNSSILKKCNVLACLATIADVVDLKFDNRNIVRDGLDIMNNQYMNNPVGVSALMNLQNLSVVNSHIIGFKIAPVINACGRMEVGAVNKAVELCITDNKNIAYEIAPKLIALNEIRKEETEKGIKIVNEIIENDCRYGENPLVIYSPDIHEGVSGIIAGRIAEDKNVSVGIFTDAPNENGISIYKGSFRSPHINIKKLLDDCNSVIYKYGGHKKAAGVSVEAGKFNDFVSLMLSKDENNYPINDKEDNISIIDVSAKDILSFFDELDKYSPFGEGNKPPLVNIKDMELYPRNGEFYSVMGKNNETVKLYGRNFSAIWFKKLKQYEKMGKPHNVNIIGEIQSSYYGKNMEVQIIISEITKNEKINSSTTSSLANALLARMKTM